MAFTSPPRGLTMNEATNEATKNVKEPLKTGQTQPTAAQKQKQDENKQKKSRGRKM